MNARWLGIDFSGNHAKWAAGCSTSNVWIADLRRHDGRLRLHDICRVQYVPGPGAPFDRLASMLSNGAFTAAAIDAPFSVPERFVHRVGGHSALLTLVGSSAPADRHFLRGTDFVRLVAGVAPPLNPKKPLRATDRWWTKLGINTRSAMWAGARGGAPMTAACLTLLYRASCPIWPWSDASNGVVAEAFPAAQLRVWGLPYQKYDGPSPLAVAHRQTIVGALSTRLQLGTWTSVLVASADALDAVLCSFAAIALSNVRCFDPACTEGCIVVHP